MTFTITLKIDTRLLKLIASFSPLPNDDLRDELCVACARRSNDTPALLEDPGHMHSCLTQQGVSVKRRHDALKLDRRDDGARPVPRRLPAPRMSLSNTLPRPFVPRSKCCVKCCASRQYIV